ncbi:SPW repeat protein [Streptacidiphilus cavernicola]|uniref:SPW repeat protein n=1 Tax=Streptacidiphilus cavernicola TaxID=3342716 RepID=A0ABV6VZH4_9ACTN
MRARYARVDGTPSAGGLGAAGSLTLLVGLWAAISPWVVHFARTNPNLQTNNLIIGIALAGLGLVFTLAPERVAQLAPVVAAIGVWMIISPWVVTLGHRPTTGMIWNNVLIGAVCCALGLAAMGMGMTGRRGRAAPSSPVTPTTTQ